MLLPLLSGGAFDRALVTTLLSESKEALGVLFRCRKANGLSWMYYWTVGTSNQST